MLGEAKGDAGAGKRCQEQVDFGIGVWRGGIENMAVVVGVKGVLVTGTGVGKIVIVIVEDILAVVGSLLVVDNLPAGIDNLPAVAAGKGHPEGNQGSGMGHAGWPRSLDLRTVGRHKLAGILEVGARL